MEPGGAGQRQRSGEKGGLETGPNPTDRGKSGSKRHVVIDANGIPLAVTLSAANVHDSRMLEATVDAIPAIRQCAGRPRRRPAKLHADKGYDFARCRRALRRRAIIPRIARRGIENSERLVTGRSRPRGGFFVEGDEVAQVLDAEGSERQDFLASDTVDPEDAVLGFHVEADLMQQILVLTEHLGDAGDGEDGGDRGHFRVNQRRRHLFRTSFEADFSW